MGHKKSLLSICGIAVGVILLISGSIVSRMGIIRHWGGDNTAAYFEYTTGYYVGVCMGAAGIIILILEVFGIVITFVREYLGRERKPIQSASSPLHPF